MSQPQPTVPKSSKKKSPAKKQSLGAFRRQAESEKPLVESIPPSVSEEQVVPIPQEGSKKKPGKGSPKKAPSKALPSAKAVSTASSAGSSSSSGKIKDFPSDFEELGRTIPTKVLFKGSLKTTDVERHLKVPAKSLIIEDGRDKKSFRLKEHVLLCFKQVTRENGSKVPEAQDAGKVRGMVVQTSDGTIVSTSRFGFTPRVLGNQVPFGQVTTEEGLQYKFDKRNRFQAEIEGPTIEINWYGREIRIRSRTKLELSTSHCGKSDMFLSLVKKALPFDPSDLFDTTKRDSPYQYSFILMDPKLTFGVRRRINGPSMVYLAMTKLWSTDPRFCPFPLEAVDCQSREHLILDHSRPFPVLSDTIDSAVYSLENLSREAANEALSKGYPIFSFKKVTGGITDLIKIRPEDCDRRLMTFGNAACREAIYKCLGDLWCPLRDFVDKYPNYSNPVSCTSFLYEREEEEQVVESFLHDCRSTRPWSLTSSEVKAAEALLSPREKSQRSKFEKSATNALRMAAEPGSTYRLRILATHVAASAPFSLIYETLRSASKIVEEWLDLVWWLRDNLQLFSSGTYEAVYGKAANKKLSEFYAFFHKQEQEFPERSYEETLQETMRLAIALDPLLVSKCVNLVQDHIKTMRLRATAAEYQRLAEEQRSSGIIADSLESEDRTTSFPSSSSSSSAPTVIVGSSSPPRRASSWADDDPTVTSE